VWGGHSCPAVLWTLGFSEPLRGVRSHEPPKTGTTISTVADRSVGPTTLEVAILLMLAIGKAASEPYCLGGMPHLILRHGFGGN